MGLNDDSTDFTTVSVSEEKDSRPNIDKAENMILTSNIENLRNLSLEERHANVTSDKDYNDVIQQLSKCKLEEISKETKHSYASTSKVKGTNDKNLPVAQVLVKDNKNVVCLSCNKSSKIDVPSSTKNYNNKSPPYDAFPPVHPLPDEFRPRSPTRNKDVHRRDFIGPYSKNSYIPNCINTYIDKSPPPALSPPLQQFQQYAGQLKDRNQTDLFTNITDVPNSTQIYNNKSPPYAASPPVQFHPSDVCYNTNKQLPGISSFFTQQRNDDMSLLSATVPDIDNITSVSATVPDNDDILSISATVPDCTLDLDSLLSTYLPETIQKQECATTTSTNMANKKEQDHLVASMPLSPKQAASPPHVAALPSVSPPASTNETTYLPVTIVTVPQPILYSGGKCMQVVYGTNGKRTRPLLPKPTENKQPIPVERNNGETICNRTSSAKTMKNIQANSVKEKIDASITMEEKVEIMRTFLTKITCLEDWYKPVDETGKTRLHLAVISKNVKLSYLLIERMRTFLKKQRKKVPEIVDIKDNSGCTPLMYAVLGNCKMLTAYLRECGADSYIKDSKYGNTPFHIATFHGNNAETVLRLLSNKDDDVNVINNEGQTVLHVALAAGKPERDELVKYLCRKGYKVGVKDKLGLTPLHYAVKSSSNDTTILKILLTEGHDAKKAKLMRDKKGNTILHTAATLKCELKFHKKLIQLLIIHCEELLEEKNDNGKMPYELVSSDREEIRKELRCTWIPQIGFGSL